jgi:hypothetical protein
LNFDLKKSDIVTFPLWYWILAEWLQPHHVSSGARCTFQRRQHITPVCLRMEREEKG